MNRVLEIKELKQKVLTANKAILRYKNIKNNSTMFIFYTGIKKPIFKWIIKYGPKVVTVKNLRVADHLLLVLVKLRMELLNSDLSYRFQLSQSAVSRIINSWLPKLAEFSEKYLIYWPEKLALRKNIPTCFKKNYNRCVSIVDCTEIFKQRPHNLNARAKTWSNYKHHNTIKYFIGCAPSGAINFISDGWGGRVSDKEITRKCGFLNLIENQDQVLADRGFTVYK